MTDIRSIPIKPDKMKELLAQIERGMDDHIKLVHLVAKMDMAKVKAYIENGFTRLEALDLLKAEKIKVSLK